MKNRTRRLISLVAALTLLVTCAISGLVLPATAEGTSAPTGNLFPNGDFEEGAVKPWTSIGDYTIEDGVGFDGSKGLVIPAHEGSKAIYAKGLGSITLEANTTYVLSYVAKGPEMRIWLGNGTDVNSFSLYSKPYSGEWTIQYELVTTGDAPVLNSDWGLSVESNSATSEPTYVDNITLVKATEADFGFGGDFNALAYNMWNGDLLSQGRASLVTESDGNKAMKLNEASTAYSAYLKSVVLLPETEYTLTFKAKGAPINVYFEGAYATGENAGKWLTTTASTDYQTYTYQFKSVAASQQNSHYTLQVCRHEDATLNVGDTLIDDFSIKVTAKAPAGTPTTTGSVAIENFENGNAGWTYGGKTESVTADGDNSVLSLDKKDTTWRGTFADVNLKANHQYLARLKVKNVGGKKACLMSALYKPDGGYWAGNAVIAATDAAEWTYYQFSFAVDKDKTGAQLGFYLENSAKTDDGAKLYIDDVELIEVSEETNLVPGGDMNTASKAFATLYGKGGTVVADTIETDNQVLYLKAGLNDLWFNLNGLQAGKLYEVSFRYRGGSIKHWFNTATHSANYQTVSGGNASDTWTTYTIYLWAKSGDAANSLMIRTDAANGSKDLWIDDMSVREVSLALSSTTASVEAGSDTTLTVTAKPAGITVPDLTWASDADTVATVDSTGKVTGLAAGTANITATAGPIVLTCAVAVTSGSSTPTPTPTTPSNLLTNGDFEQGNTNWDIYRYIGTGTVEFGAEGAGKDGGKGAKITLTNTADDKRTQQCGFRYTGKFFGLLEENTKYVFSYDYKWEGTGEGIWFEPQINPGTGYTGDWKKTNRVKDTEWTTFSIEFITGTNITTNQGWEFLVQAIMYDNKVGTGTAYFDNFSLVKQEKKDATGITLDKTSATVGMGSTLQLTATADPVYSNYESISWVSDNTDAATVDSTGKVTGVATGDANITATLKVNATTTYTATCAVKVVVLATDFAITQSELHLAPELGTNLRVYETLGVTTTPAGAYIDGITWSSNADTVATVDANGKVTALKAGTAIITGTWNGISHTVTVKVDEQGERIPGGDFEGDDWNVVNWTNNIIKDGACELVTENGNTYLKVPASLTSAVWLWPAQIRPGRTYKLTMKMKNAEGKGQLYLHGSYVAAGDKGWATKEISSTDWEEVTYIFTTVSENLNRNYTIGFGQAQGTSTTDVYIDDMSLVEMPMATALTMADVELKVNGTATMQWAATPENHSTGKLNWTSSDPTVIAVDANGKLTAVAGEGEVTITVQSADDANLKATAKATIVGDYATSLSLNRNKLYVGKGAQSQLTMTLLPAGSRYKAITWTSSDDTVATVDNTGLVTASNTKAGTATITVKSGDLQATCLVTVMEPATSIALAEDSIKLGTPAGSDGRYQVTQTLTIATTPANTDPGAVTWASSNETVATVDANGKVTALAEGKATITLYKDSAPVDTCEVTVAFDGERIVGGTFDNDDWNIADWTNNIVKSGRGSVVTDPADENNMVLSLPNDNNKLDALWVSNLKVNAAKAYKLTFKVKGDGTENQELAVYFHGTSLNLSGWKYTSKLTTEWKTVTYTFQTNALDDGTGAAINRNYCFGFDNNKAGNIYLDDVSLVELPDATSLTIVASSDTVELWPEGSTTLSLRTEPAEAGTGAITWASSDDSIVSVDQNGKITAVAESGTVTITATSELGHVASIKVTIDEYANVLANGDFEQGDLYWPGHANIQAGVGKNGSYGMVLDGTKTDYFYKGNLAVKPGTTYIVEWDYLATYEAGFRLWAGNLGLSLYAKEGDGTTWQHGSEVFTTPTNMVEINNNRYFGWIFSVTSDKAGTPAAIVDNITLRMYDSGVELDSMKLSHESVTLMPGRTQGVNVMPTPVEANINGMNWSSSNEDVATVEYGVITAIGKGTATITAEKDGKKASCTVTVSGEPAFITNGTFEKTESNWALAGSAAIEAGAGVNKTNAAALSGDGTFTYQVANLQSDKTYNLHFRYRSANGSKLGVSLTNGSAELLNETVTGEGSWTKASYEIKTGTLTDDTTVFTMQVAGGNGPIYVDNVYLVEAVTAIDFVVEGLAWDNNEQVTPGTEIQFFVTITNQGEDPVPAGSTIDVDICVDSKVIQRIPYTFANEFTTGSRAMIEGTEKWAAVKGDHVISARVNSTLSVLELNPDNNNTVQSDLRVNETILEAPEIAQQAGFTTLGFSDDFETLDTIDSGATGLDGYKWYVTRPYGASTVTPDAYSIENGVLTIKDKEPTYNMSLSSVDYTNGIGFQWNKGYIETRFRIPRPRENTETEKGIPAIWSLPLEKLQANTTTQWVEMDWLEYWGITESRPGGHYTITLHDQATVNDVQTHYNVNGNPHREGLGNDEWHTMAWLWVQDHVIGYLDGEEVFRLQYNESTFSDPMPNIKVNDENGGIGAFSYMNEQMLVMHLGGSYDNPIEIDYLRIWTSVDGGSYTPDDDDDDDENNTVLVDMDAEQFWFNFCTDDYGDLITEITYDNYLNVLAGEEIWNQLSAERQAEINALLAANGQPTFDELLLAAKAMKELVDSGWTPDDEDITDPDDDDVVTPDDDTDTTPDTNTGEPDDDDIGAEDNTKTGATSALPAALAVAVAMSAAVLWLTGKRRKA